MEAIDWRKKTEVNKVNFHGRCHLSDRNCVGTALSRPVGYIYIYLCKVLQVKIKIMVCRWEVEKVEIHRDIHEHTRSACWIMT